MPGLLKPPFEVCFAPDTLSTLCPAPELDIPVLYPFCATLAQASFRVMVRFKINFASVLSLSKVK